MGIAQDSHIDMTGSAQFVCIFFTTIFSVACETHQRLLPVDHSTTLELNTDWPYSPRWSGTYVDSVRGEEFIFSGDPNTRLMVRVFDNKGVAVLDIPLGPVLDSLGSINSFTLIARDSLFVLEEHGPNYAIVDLKGKVARRGTFEGMLCDEHGDLYDLNGYSNGLAWFGGALYLETDWTRACTDTAQDEPTSLVEVHKQYFSHATSKCKVAKFRLHYVAPSVLFGACGILPHLMDTPRSTIGGVRRIVTNGRLFVISPYSEYINYVDTRTLDVIRTIPIRYLHGSVGITPPPITAEDIRNEGHNIRLATKATIVSFAYDSTSRQYLVMIYHEVPETSHDTDRGLSRDWSLVVLDTDFAPIDEYIVPRGEYMPGCILSADKGTWVLVDRPGGMDAREPKVFKRISLQ